MTNTTPLTGKVSKEAAEKGKAISNKRRGSKSEPKTQKLTGKE
jgi:hypothetical protein